MSTVWDWFWAIVGVGGGFAGVAALLWLQARGAPERDAEEAARAHYDRTGRWPDD